MTFASERELCSAFMAWAKAQGWTPYAETAGWDILLTHPDGTQIGVQAKVAFNLKVLLQVVPDAWTSAFDGPGPDFRAILCPRRPDADDLLAALGIVAFYPQQQFTFLPQLEGGFHERLVAPWHWWNPSTRCELPEYVPDVAAGVAAPTQLTRWKIGALKICALLEVRGTVTRQDFRELGMDHRLWIGPKGWLVPGDQPGIFVAGALPPMKEQHPTIYAEILEAARSR